MLRNANSNSNVHMEMTTKKETWRTLCLKPEDLLLANIFPESSRGCSIEHLKFDSGCQSKPFSSNNRYKVSESHTNSLSNSTEVSYEKQLEMAESKLYEISKLKNKLSCSFSQQKESLKTREKEIIAKELELKNNKLAFEEEKKLLQYFKKKWRKKIKG